VLLLHGFGGSAWTMGPMLLAEALGPRFRMAAPALANGQPDQTLDGLADRLAALIEGLAWGPLNVVAHSLGGTVACHLVATRPDLIRRMLLLAPLLHHEQLRAPIYGKVDGFFGHFTAAASIVRQYTSDLIGHTWRLPFLLPRFTPSGSHAPLLQVVRSVDVRADLEMVRIPTVLLYGDADPILDTAAYATLQGTHLQTHAIPGVGHLSQFAAPHVVERVMIRLFR
jgi:pimeloyl-ACP methyl ester carboxylesterase